MNKIPEDFEKNPYFEMTTSLPLVMGPFNELYLVENLASSSVIHSITKSADYSLQSNKVSEH